MHISKNSMAKVLTPNACERIAARFRLLGDASRLKLLAELRQSKLSVSELAQRTGLSQPNASKQLQTLTQGGILSRKKDGLNVYYCICDSRVMDMCKIVCDCLETHLEKEIGALRSPKRKRTS